MSLPINSSENLISIKSYYKPEEVHSYQLVISNNMILNSQYPNNKHKIDWNIQTVLFNIQVLSRMFINSHKYIALFKINKTCCDHRLYLFTSIWISSYLWIYDNVHLIQQTSPNRLIWLLTTMLFNTSASLLS